jgi:hypothetical protein
MSALIDEYRRPSTSVQFPFALARRITNHFLPTLRTRPPLAHPCRAAAAASRALARARLLACPLPPPLGRGVPAGRPTAAKECIFSFLINVFRLFRDVFNIFRFSIGVVFSIFRLIR